VSSGARREGFSINRVAIDEGLHSGRSYGAFEMTSRRGYLQSYCAARVREFANLAVCDAVPEWRVRQDYRCTWINLTKLQNGSDEECLPQCGSLDFRSWDSRRGERSRDERLWRLRFQPTAGYS
jgi:hypothetical protein